MMSGFKLRRFVCAAAAIALGWAAQMGVFLMVASPSAHDLRLWTTATGLYCIAAALFVGIPVATMEPAAYVSRQFRAAVVAGVAGMLLAAVPPSTALIVITGPLGFFTGAFAMLVYTSIVNLFPESFGAQ